MSNSSMNAVARRLGIRHPVIQGPFGGGLSTDRLAAAVSNAGGLGSFGVHHLAPEAIDRVARDIRSLTALPFALNLWISDHDAGGLSLTAAQYDRYAKVFAPYFRELGIETPATPDSYTYRYEDQLEALLEARPAAFSFVFGVPSVDVLAACRSRHIVTIGTATSVAEAQALETAGVDLIVATGMEAGGHRPSFLDTAERSLMGTFALLQLVSRRVRTPVIAAGGIADQRGMRAAHALGAAAIQVGTAFLACEESGATNEHRAALFSSGTNGTALTRAFSGRLARGLRNRWVEEMSDRTKDLAPFPVQNWFVSRMRPAAVAAQRTDLVSLWSGQIAPVLQHHTAALLMNELTAES
ncbi:MAG: nitronate monooxygenase [Pseudomonadota bacterium]